MGGSGILFGLCGGNPCSGENPEETSRLLPFGSTLPFAACSHVSKSPTGAGTSSASSFAAFNWMLHVVTGFDTSCHRHPPFSEVPMWSPQLVPAHMGGLGAGAAESWSRESIRAARVRPELACRELGVCRAEAQLGLGL